MPFDKLENASGVVGISAGAGTAAGNFAGWMTANATLIGLGIAVAGLMLQAYFGYRRDLREFREHELRVQALMENEE